MALQFEPQSGLSKRASIFKLGGLTTDGIISAFEESATENDLPSLFREMLLKQNQNQGLELESDSHNNLTLRLQLPNPEDAIVIEDQQDKASPSESASSSNRSDHEKAPGRKSNYAKFRSGRKSPPLDLDQKLRKRAAFENDNLANEDFKGLLNAPYNLKSRCSLKHKKSSALSQKSH